MSAFTLSSSFAVAKTAGLSKARAVKVRARSATRVRPRMTCPEKA
jgi:hypothetical protein